MYIKQEGGSEGRLFGGVFQLASRLSPAYVRQYQVGDGLCTCATPTHIAGNNRQSVGGSSKVERGAEWSRVGGKGRETFSRSGGQVR